jgi:hypothetical protein
LNEYSRCSSYWYIPKARALRKESGVISDIQKTLNIIFNEFLGEIWNQETQDKILERLIKAKILEPYKKGKKQDRTALTRIHKKLWELLGLLWVEDNHEIIMTDAGVDLIAASGNHRSLIIEGQIAKWQYPNPSFPQFEESTGILPHLFLLQVLQQLRYRIDFDEYELFVNLAKSQNDLDRIVNYIKHWRDLNKEEQDEILEVVKKIPMPEVPTNQAKLFDDNDMFERDNIATRYRRIHLDSAYQRAFFTFPYYLDEKDNNILCLSSPAVDKLVQEKLKDFKISKFKNKVDWFAYYGNPKLQPSWFTYLSLAIERAESQKKAKEIVKEAKGKLKPEEEKEIIRKQIEKGIEDFFVGRLYQIEEGLKLLEKNAGDKLGRQFSTPIGLIDLLCLDNNRTYVVIEIKADEAEDSAFGQILRYMGWIHRNIKGGKDNVRGIILASEFTEKVRYSRIGLEPLNYKAYKEYIKFKKHGLTLQDT